MRRAPLLAFLLLYAVPALAAPEKEAPTSFLGLPVWLWKTANLLLFAGLLIYLLAKPMSRFFHSRREEIARQIAEAARQREEAERMRAEMASRIAALASEVAALRERLRSEGERERGELARQGEAEAARLLAQLDHEAERRVAEARSALAGEAAQIVAEMARELLERELTEADRERIFKRTLERLAVPAAGGAR